MPIKLVEKFLFVINFGLAFCQPAGANHLLFQADSLYIQRNYHEALDRYQLVVDHDQYLKHDFAINFKLGVCYLKNNYFAEAKNIFDRLQKDYSQIPEYVDYYFFLSGYAIDDATVVIERGRRFINRNRDHFLADSVRVKLADYQFQHSQYNEALKEYARLSSRKTMKKKKAYLLSKIAICRLNLGQKNEALETMYQVMKKYPDDPSALEIADLFLFYPAPSEKYEFAIADVYLKHKKFGLVTKRLEAFIKETKDETDKEKARFYIILIYYEKQSYRTALYGFKNILTGLKDKSLESRIRLSIARCYLRLGEMKKSVDAYMDYAGRYPRRRMAVECVWKANWIYEELGEIEKSLAVNQDLLKHWPRSIYRDEAKFRVGFINLRLSNYQAAENSFKSIRLNSKSSDFNHNRASFWLAKTYEAVRKKADAERIYLDLGREPLTGYYNLRSYMSYQMVLDSVYQISQKLGDQKNPLRFHTNELSSLMIRFENLFLIRELLGDDLAMQELSEKKYYPEKLREWIALAEIYKKLGAYNESYRIYDYINKKHFADLTDLEKPYLLKESYPLYFDTLVGYYGQMRNLDKHLILALIRAESSFNSRAHSWADAYGLMQIIPNTAKALAIQLDEPYSHPEVLFDPEYNINLGTLYLSNLLVQFENKFEYAIAAYNAGPHRVTRWEKFRDASDLEFFVENIEYTQTRNYVRRVMLNYWIYLLLKNVSQSY